MIVAGSASPLLLASAGGYNLTKSLRFRRSASAYLNRTFSSPTNNKLFTWSGWVKRSEIGVWNDLFGVGGSNGFGFNTAWNDNGLAFFTNNISGDYFYLVTTQVFRDPSAWYHIVLSVDTTQATASNRAKIYVNGVQITAFNSAVYQSQNSSLTYNSATTHYLCSLDGSIRYFDGYLAEVNFIDGQALTPSSFGQTSTTTGVWIPKKYSGSYGTNGFYLKFTDTTSTSTLGTDFSGNSNTWTVNNISLTSGSTYDSMNDVPTLTSATTANYCVLNPLSKGANVSATNGNLNAVISGGSAESLQSTLGMASGKWYCEMTAGGGGSIFGITTVGANLSSWVGSDTKGYGYRGDTGAVMYNSSALVSGMSTFASGDVISLAFDADAGKLWFAKNGTWYNSGSPSAGTNATVSSIASGTWFVSVGRIAATNDAQFNFGQQPFAYTPPTGFVRLNTFNLPTPTIGATASTTANKYMNIALYTGTGSSQSITGLGFQPDWTWIKSRSGATDHGLYDAVRGVQKQLESNTTTAETTETTGLTAFGSDGFTVGALAQLNTSSATYVGWNWKANGAGSTNTAGSITSTVSASTTAGFSIVKINASGSSGSIGHGLGVAPSMIIGKNTAGADDWYTYHASIGTGAFIRLNTNGAQSSSASAYTNINSTTFTAGSGVLSNNAHIFYCFAQVAGYSAFGSYTGNGSTDGAFIFTGFRPRYLMIKSTSVESWELFDTSRSPYNQAVELLEADSSGAENTSNTSAIDILSNGFKQRNTRAATNGSGTTYIYMAFAEVPYKFSNAR